MRGKREGNGTENTERPYFYYQCKGKFKEDENGIRRHICTGHLFTLKTKLAYCPVCGEPLGMLESKTPRTEAVTLAMEKCFFCRNREKSKAVNDLRCVGKSEKRGKQDCIGCFCDECCKDTKNDFDIGKRFGFSKTLEARGIVRETAKWITRHGSADAEAEKRIAETRANNRVLKDMPDKDFARWVYETVQEAEKEAKMFPMNEIRRQTGQKTSGPMNGVLLKAVNSLA